MPCECATYLRRLLLEMDERSRGVSGADLLEVDRFLDRCENHAALAVRDTRMTRVLLGQVLAKIEHPESFVTDDPDKTPVRTIVFNDDTQPDARAPGHVPRPRGRR